MPLAMSLTTHDREIVLTLATEQAEEAVRMKLPAAVGNYTSNLVLYTLWLTGGKGKLSLISMLT